MIIIIIVIIYYRFFVCIYVNGSANEQYCCFYVTWLTLTKIWRWFVHNLYTICTQKVYTNPLHCTECILDVYIENTHRKCDWFWCIPFVYSSKRMCTESIQQIQTGKCYQCWCTVFTVQPEEAYKKYTIDTNWKYVINFDVQFSQYNQKKHTKSIQ